MDQIVVEPGVIDILRERALDAIGHLPDATGRLAGFRIPPILTRGHHLGLGIQRHHVGIVGMFVSDYTKVIRIGDVEYNRVLAIPGMGPALSNTLCNWRSQIERQFTLNRSQGIPPAERHALLLKYAQVRQQLELKLRQGPNELRKTDLDLREFLGHLASQLDGAHVAVAQAIADLAAMRHAEQRRR